MYGLNIAQRGGVSQIYPPYCALPYRANGQNCPLLKMSKTLENRESLSRNVGNPLKKSRFRFAHLWGKWCSAASLFSDRPWKQHFTDSFSVYCVLPQTHTTVRISDSCPVSLPWASIQKYAVCMASSCRASKNRSERRVGGHKGICRTWPDAEHIPLRPIFTRFPARKHPDIYEFGKN